MWRSAVLLITGLALTPATASAQAADSARAAEDAFLGRWDITIEGREMALPSWMEIRRSGFNTLVGEFVGVSGSARPVARVDVRDGRMRFAIPPQWEPGTSDLIMEGRLDGERLVGAMTFPAGERRDWTAVRAPSLRREGEPEWGAPITLFNGKDVSGWHVIGGEGQWRAENGILRNVASGGNLVTDGTWGDFKLHLEFRYPANGNSGVYLRGRHEVQIQDDAGKEPASDRFSGIYGFLPPSEMVAKAPGEWQSYDITLVGRTVTVVANGKTVICEREIPGITGGALDSDEGEPGPLMLQGDHGPVEFRNIILTPAR